jgi:hypothetical protein
MGNDGGLTATDAARMKGGDEGEAMLDRRFFTPTPFGTLTAGRSTPVEGEWHASVPAPLAAQVLSTPYSVLFTSC